MVTLALRERVPEGRVREPPRSDACAYGNSLSPILSRLRDVALQREGLGGEGESGLDGKGLNKETHHGTPLACRTWANTRFAPTGATLTRRGESCIRPASCLLPPASCLLPPASCLLPPAPAPQLHSIETRHIWQLRQTWRLQFRFYLPSSRGLSAFITYILVSYSAHPLDSMTGTLIVTISLQDLKDKGDWR
jgi:hypothetical protein